MRKEEIIQSTNRLEGLVQILNKDQEYGRIKLPTLFLAKLNEVIMESVDSIRREANQLEEELLKLQQIIKEKTDEMAAFKTKLKNPEMEKREPKDEIEKIKLEDGLQTGENKNPK